MAHRPEEGRDKSKSYWEAGLWMGRVATTGEHIVGCPIGVLKVRSVRRRPELLQLDTGLFDCMVGRSWAAQLVQAVLKAAPAGEIPDAVIEEDEMHANQSTSCTTS